MVYSRSFWPHASPQRRRPARRRFRVVRGENSTSFVTATTTITRRPPPRNEGAPEKLWRALEARSHLCISGVGCGTLITRSSSSSRPTPSVRLDRERSTTVDDPCAVRSASAITRPVGFSPRSTRIQHSTGVRRGALADDTKLRERIDHAMVSAPHSTKPTPCCEELRPCSATGCWIDACPGQCDPRPPSLHRSRAFECLEFVEATSTHGSALTRTSQPRAARFAIW